MGKSLESCLIGKRGRLLGIQWGFGDQCVGLLYVLEVLLTDESSLLTDESSLLTDELFLQLTDGVLRIDNV